MKKAMDWEADLIAMRAKSERKAWTIAKVAVGVAVLEAIGLVTLAPMRQTVPVCFHSR
ncbi:VirB8/TrbF family protein [Acinetobacter lwoffii]|uniref:VirB8/TrbF family protein n=1 Tax=Acinetobacter lwoffii TaxID=28090 RepID=UPI00107993B3|nr:VirB8/TrbF family protein [Acinetobacter lwoffii]VFQ41141.1 Pertussis toxin liberation protein E [Acinetobacter lwoffii]